MTKSSTVPCCVGLIMFGLFAFLGTFIYGVGLYGIWKPNLEQYNTYTPAICNVTNYYIYVDWCQDSNNNDCTNYIPRFNVYYIKLDENATNPSGNAKGMEYKDMRYYNVKKQAEDVINRYKDKINFNCMARSIEDIVYFIYSGDDIKQTIFNLEIAGYVMFGFAGLGLMIVITSILTSLISNKIKKCRKQQKNNNDSKV
ncbi:Transmembrane domain-containing protein [Orpheovirus IHUMI-LCC2]|uniref:Transmembrane domain-containing protein n=1 Tax=Orpheovirus IHUMI-LCC2 TaxID=2023057 RepID=A0A2I2L336_9VIRU|nr:Transmembrane domain-containing protein [Orpheovirus IHUMI-LCC2]SNW61944.1 Transmembrane domain-containing protein [Orpheovirus IHUMI-LCC2]